MGYYWDSDFATVDTKSLDISKEISKDVRKLNGDGDFRSEECIELLKQADIVVTNPPFSLFGDFISMLNDYDKDFVIIGPLNCITLQKPFQMMINDRMRCGYHFETSGFLRPDGHILTNHVSRSCWWFTSLKIDISYRHIDLTETYSETKYPKYDNADAVEVSKKDLIPYDYDGVMGVPISFMKHYNPEQFVLIGNEKTMNIKGRCKIDGQLKYARLFIKNKTK